ncbi:MULTISPECIES: winged helix-turn-helix domain-containing protein [Sphingobacterium]|uniref:winged helix-turn-helix domain-containing protein n=1 Tax=Sphingobacterium TaxID=28453 RepID=UPI00240D65F4|nr:helix-turn-helix domain-containing protein [Sphingobacterium sp. WM]WFB65214.1 helix-turn-helix domain-containing protein [Sphingobacterium sp. WM]
MEKKLLAFYLVQNHFLCYRSLDMFISKLRKKLELDPSIKIVVVRSKGYRLELNF